MTNSFSVFRNGAMHRVSCVIAFASAVLFSSFVSADTIYLKADATGGGDGSSWANAYTTIDEAVAALNSAPAGSELRVAAGVYKVSAPLSVTATNFTISGGYRAAADDDVIRDLSEYPSVLFQGTKANLESRTLQHYTLKVGKYDHINAEDAFGAPAMTYCLAV